MSEHQEQCNYFKWVNDMMKIDHRYENIYAVPNGSQRSKKATVQLKNEGLRTGVLDINIDWPIGRFHGARIELKVKDGSLSDDQKKWIERYNKAGYFTSVCWSADELIKTTLDYFGNIDLNQ